MEAKELNEIWVHSYFAESVSANVVKSLLAHIAVSEDRCNQCYKDNDSRESLDMCESCEIQNKMDALKGE